VRACVWACLRGPVHGCVCVCVCVQWGSAAPPDASEWPESVEPDLSPLSLPAPLVQKISVATMVDGSECMEFWSVSHPFLPHGTCRPNLKRCDNITPSQLRCFFLFLTRKSWLPTHTHTLSTDQKCTGRKFDQCGKHEAHQRQDPIGTGTYSLIVP
jgi:hypothetical protein